MKKIAAMTLLGLLSINTWAAEPECTKESKDKWKDAKAFETELAKTYKIKKFKVTKGNCYEIYGHSKEGKRVEIYFNPVTGEKVKENIE